MADLESHKMSNAFLEEMNNLIETYCPQCGMKNDPNNFRRICSKCKDLNMFRCLHQKCDKSYKHVTNLRTHIKKNHLKLEIENSLKCPSCCKKFIRLDILNEHSKICFKKATLVCEYCDFKTDWPKNLRRHMLKWHRKLSNIRSCKKCNKVFLDAKGLNVHKNRFCRSNFKFNKGKKKDETYIDNCGKRKKSSSILLNKGLKKFKMHCPICNEKSNDLQFQKINKCKECEVPMAIYCKKCKLRFRKIDAIIVHSKKDCKPEKILHCDDCKYTSHKKSHLREHIEAKHLCKKRCCLKCGNSYTLLRHLKKHKKCCNKLVMSKHQNLTEDPKNLNATCKIELEATEVSDEMFLIPCENLESLVTESELDVESIEILDRTRNSIKIEKKNMESDIHIVESAIFAETDSINIDENEKVNRFVKVCCPACDTKFGPNNYSIICTKCKKPNEFHCLHPYCYLHFTQLHGLKLHIQREHLLTTNQPEKTHKSPTRSKSFRYIKNMQKHNSIRLNAVIDQCEVNHPDHLDQNVETRYENPVNETHICKNCNDNFLSVQSLKKHEKQCTEPIRIVICSNCNHKTCKRLRCIAHVKAQQKKKCFTSL